MASQTSERNPYKYSELKFQPTDKTYERQVPGGKEAKEGTVIS